jgi:hypothetical protein
MRIDITDVRRACRDGARPVSTTVGRWLPRFQPLINKQIIIAFIIVKLLFCNVTWIM